jgi:hypothetical protein
VYKYEVIQSDPNSIVKGLFRDLKRVLMKGTPENAISRKASKIVKDGVDKNKSDNGIKPKKIIFINPSHKYLAF